MVEEVIELLTNEFRRLDDLLNYARSLRITREIPLIETF